MDVVENLHIVVLPWIGFSHLNPMFQLSKRMAQLGQRISFLSTPTNIQKLASDNPNLSQLFNLVPLSPPVHADGTDRSIEQNIDALKVPVAEFLHQASPPPDWILFDHFFYWIPRIAANLRVSTAHVSLIGAAANAFMWPAFAQFTNSINSAQGYGHIEIEQLIMPQPPKWASYPTSTISYRLHEARQVLDDIFEKSTAVVQGGYRVGSSIIGCNVVAIRSSTELEAEWLAVLERLYGKPVLALGHIPPSVDAAITVDAGSENWNDMVKWLGKREVGSVVYIAFGSELILGKKQVQELARGIELSNLPFIWAMRGSDGELNELLHEGFKDRTRGRGLICKGWVPQVKILGHPSVGGFMTHCGWNSLIEALHFGVPLVLLPLVCDQGLNARLMVEKKVGMEVPVNEADGSFVGADVARALRLVMVEKEGGECRAKSKEIKKILGRNEVHDNYVRRFVEYLKKNRQST